MQTPAVKNQARQKATAIIWLIFSSLFAIPCTYLLIFKAKVFEAPELILYFPQAYILLIGGSLGGIICFIIGLYKLKLSRKTSTGV